LFAKLNSEGLYRKYTMKELIWGYHDPMMTAAMSLLPDMFYTDFVGVYAGVSLHVRGKSSCFQAAIFLTHQLLKMFCHY